MLSIPEHFSFKNLTHILAFGLGSGLAKVAPGTWGSLVGVLLALPLLGAPVWLLLVVLIGGFFLGVYLCGKTAQDLGVHDHGGIVWDEFVGQWLVLFFMPEKSWPYIILAFLLFRVFDVIKPWPIKWLDKKVHGGFGIMIDDVLAGIFALLCLFLVFALDVNERLLTLGFTQNMSVIGLP